MPKIKLLPGERHRERVVMREEEARYLAAVKEPPASIATILADTGFRPEECYRMRWEGHHLGQWPQRDVACHAWKDRCCPSRAPHRLRELEPS